MPQHPELLEEGDVSDLPADGIHDRQPGTHQLLVGEVGDQFKGTLMRFCKLLDENKWFIRAFNRGHADTSIQLLL